MLDDQVYTERQQVTKQPGTCLHCHASVYVPYRKAGGGDLFKGFEALNQMPYAEARELVKYPGRLHRLPRPARRWSCASRGPAFLEGIKAAKAAAWRRRTTTSTPMATRQEMRAFVCGQCHVEYYFKGAGEAAHLSVVQGPEGRADRGLLRRDRLQGLDPRRHRRAGAQGAAPRVRDVEPGHPRPLAAWPAPTATCRTSARARSRSATTTSAARS